ncbi:MAG: elongation factor G [Planctomycetaceae bacterium]|nr:elongation factor G [Planctomycetaceae bacterium]
MARNIAGIRNIGIIAHIDAGKTTLTERMLFFAGSIHRSGDVDKGTTTTDFDPEEQQRGITIYAACVTFPWHDCIVNLIDTPGHVDFTAEVERSLRVLDGAVVVFSAREGVEAQSETVWRQADRHHVPRLAFINKMDREGADFYGTFEEIRNRLEANPVAIQIPVGVGPPHLPDRFRGLIDLIRMKFVTFSAETQGREETLHEIPEELLDQAQEWRNHLLEALYDQSQELMELGLSEAPIPEELLHKVVREATIARKIVPVLCGTALDYVGIPPVLDSVARYLPSPLDVPPVEGVDPKKLDKKLKRGPDPEEPFCGLVFKILADKHGDLAFVRVYSGTLKANSRVFNPGKEEKENVSQLWHIQADDRKQVPSVEAGDIVGIIGLRHSITGDTLCEVKDPILLERITFPETVISMAIEPETSAERKKLADTLEMLKRQDPTFRAGDSTETGQTLISGMGELHLEVIKHRLLRDFKLNVKVHKPRVSYRETVAKAVEATGECRQQIAGKNLFAKVRIRLEPLPDSPLFALAAAKRADKKEITTLAANLADESLPQIYQQAAMEVLQQQIEGSGLVGFPLMKVKVTLLGGEFSETESDELAFRRAAADAFHDALQAAGPQLLEPIMQLEITTPEENLGDIVADLQQRRATITETSIRGRSTIVRALAPLAALFGYAGAIRSLSQGRASCSMEPAAYGPAPKEVLDTFLL